MTIDNQLDITKSNFDKYLSSLGISSKSYKNYRSDLNHFISWVILRIRSFGSFVESLTEVVPFLSQDIAQEYRNFMIESSFPDKTINRRLSTLRHLSRFLISTQATDIDFMGNVENISTAKVKKSQYNSIINEFRAHLESQKVSPNTIKNYLSDIRQFLLWLENNNQPPIDGQ